MNQLNFLSLLLVPAIFLSSSLLSFGQTDNSLSFEGFDDVVSIPGASAQIASSTNGMSLSCWVYATNPAPNYPNFDGIAGFRNESTCDFYLLHLSATSLEARFRNSTGTAYTATAPGFSINTWQHVVITYDGTSLKVYINGSQKISVPASGSISSTSEVMYLGKLPFSPNDFQLGGQLDDVALWDKALSSSEIGCMYNYGHDDSSTNLKLHYTFDQGVASGTNTGIASLTDSKGNINGTLSGFALSGSSSNFIAGVVQAGSTSTSICKGDSVAFGSAYYSTAGTYSVKIPLTGGCDSIARLVLSIDSVDVGVSAITGGAAFQANATGATYQWIDCATKQPVAGATQRTFTPTTVGQFAVVVTDNGCTDTSVCLTSTVGLTENELPLVSVFPNPTQGRFTFSQGLDFDGGKLEIVSAAGIRVASFPIEARPESQLEIQLPAGVYLIDFYRADGRRGAFPLVVQP